MKKVMYNNSELSGSFGQENTPIGTILMYGGTTLPFGYMWCNGSAVSRTVYAELFNAIGTAFGSGDGSTTFNLPDYRESVPVGAGHNDTQTIANHDEYTVGQFKDDQIQNHEHQLCDNNTPITASTTLFSSGTTGKLPLTNATSYQPVKVKNMISCRSGNTTHGKQLGCNFIIKFCKAISPTQEQFIDDSTVSAGKTWSSAKITQKLTEWVDITDQVILTQVSASGAWSYTLKKFYMCGNQVKCTIGVMFNHSGSAGTNPLKLKISSPLFTTTAELSRVYHSSFYGASVWTQGLNVYGGESDIITFRPNSNYASGTDAHFDVIIAVIPR